jgi:ribosomal protein L24
MTKEEYRKNREQGLRGQGVYIETQELVRPSNVAIIGTTDKNGKTKRFAMNRAERRRIKLDVNKMEWR